MPPERRRRRDRPAFDQNRTCSRRILVARAQFARLVSVQTKGEFPHAHADLHVLPPSRSAVVAAEPFDSRDSSTPRRGAQVPEVAGVGHGAPRQDPPLQRRTETVGLRAGITVVARGGPPPAGSGANGRSKRIARPTDGSHPCWLQTTGGPPGQGSRLAGTSLRVTRVASSARSAVGLRRCGQIPFLDSTSPGEWHVVRARRTPPCPRRSTSSFTR